MEDNIPDDNSLSDENNDIEEREDNEFENMLKQAREEKNKKTRKEKPKNSFQQQLLELQGNELQSFQDSELRMQEMMLKIFEEQRKADMAEREKDRQFMLQLGKIFAQKQD